jgi:hypothetical protein
MAFNRWIQLLSKLTFNRWIQLLTLIVLFLTLLAAVCIGFEQGAISRKQTQINESLLELQYAISVVGYFDKSTNRFLLRNSGQTNAYFARFQIHGSKPDFQTPPRLILPHGGEHRLNIDWPLLEKTIKDSAAGAPETDVPWQVSLLDERNVKYVLRGILHCMISNDQITIETQTARAEKANWYFSAYESTSDSGRPTSENCAPNFP